MNLLPLLSTPAARFRLSFTARKPMDLSGIEPVIRSRIGFNLRRASCPFPDFRKRPCEACSLAKHCLYVTLFGPKSVKTLPDAAGRSGAILQPFVHGVTADSGANAIRSGDNATAMFTLFGPAIQHCTTFMEAAASAILSFPTKIGTLSPIHPDPDESEIAAPLAQWIGSDGPENGKLTIRFLSPVRLVKNEQVNNQEPSFDLLMTAMIRRLRDLKRSFGTDRHMGELGDEYQKRIDAVTTRSADLEWVRRRRYSRRQKQPVRLDGWMGEIAFDGPADVFRPLLKAGEFTHIGKGTSSGCGRIQIL